MGITQGPSQPSLVPRFQRRKFKCEIYDRRPTPSDGKNSQYTMKMRSKFGNKCIADVTSMINVRTKDGGKRFHGTGETDIITKTSHKFNKVSRPWGQGQVMRAWLTCITYIINLWTKYVKPMLYVNRETDPITKPWHKFNQINRQRNEVKDRWHIFDGGKIWKIDFAIFYG